jgi:S-adenosylmethionine synthetase
MRLVIGDRATMTWKDEDLHIGELATDAARQWIGDHLRHVNPVTDVTFEVALKPGSPELTRLYAETVTANDTAAAVGYAPMTETERLVLELERYANNPAFKAQFPETGEDVKVMGVRTGRTLDLTVAMPLVDRYLANEQDYFDRKHRVQEQLLSFVREHTSAIDDVSLVLNATDHQGDGLAGIYASVLGTSADGADSGEVGRGNRANGLISFSRPGGAEAIAGKNPVGHVGKIYGMFTFALAETLIRRITELANVTVWMYSRIGQPIGQPQRVFLLTHVAPGADTGNINRAARAIVEEELAALPAFCRALQSGERQIP